jgi:hypothetical protein
MFLQYPHCVPVYFKTLPAIGFVITTSFKSSKLAAIGKVEIGRLRKLPEASIVTKLSVDAKAGTSDILTRVLCTVTCENDAMVYSVANIKSIFFMLCKFYRCENCVTSFYIYISTIVSCQLPKFVVCTPHSC